MYKHTEELGFESVRVRFDRYTKKVNDEKIITDPLWMDYRFGDVTFYEDVKKKNPDLIWYADKDGRKSIDYKKTKEVVILSGDWKLGEIQKIALALLVRELSRDDKYLFHGSAVRYRDMNILYMKGRENSGATMTLLETLHRGGNMISGEGMIIDKNGDLLAGTENIFLEGRLEGTERSDKVDTGWNLFFDELPEEYELIQEDIGNVDLLIFPDIDGHYRTESSELDQFEKEYQTYECSGESYFLSHELLSSKIPPPSLEHWEDKVRRSRFCSYFTEERPCYVIRAKTPQLIIDEVDEIIDNIKDNQTVMTY